MVALANWLNGATAVVQTAPAAQVTPPIVGIGGQVIFFALLVVMLVVPWIMSRAAEEPSQSHPEPVSSWFSSEQERRLWTWATIVLVFIYLTLSPAQRIATELRERNLLNVTSAVFLLAVGLVITWRWAKRRPGRREVGAAVGVAAIYAVTVVRLPVPEARSHLFEYGLLAMLIYHAFVERRRNGRRVPVPALLALAATVLLGWLDEVIQFFLPNRVYDLVDVGLNAAFALMGIVASVVIGWARRRDIFKRMKHAS